MRIYKIFRMNIFLVAIMMMTISLCWSSQVQADQLGDYIYTVTNGKAQITKYTGSGGVVTIPSELGKDKNLVTSIGEEAFKDCSGLTSINIPQGVTSIGTRAFYNCIALTSISIPQGVTSIGNKAFGYCSGLTSISIPEGVTSISDYTFYGCTELITINIPKGVTSVGLGAFYECSHLTSISLPESVTSIGASAFYGCLDLTSINIPQGVTSIKDLAFYCCTSLTSISIPQRVTSIGANAFSYCSALTSISIPQGVTSIECATFSDCTGLTSISIPKEVTVIGESAFYNCSGLTSISIPENVTGIGNGAFYGCSSLTSISIPPGVTSIGSWTFRGCTGLITISIPKEVTSINYAAFDHCSGLTSINIPESVTSISGFAFAYCTSLTSISMPQGVTSIGTGAFHECTSLTSIRFKSATTTIYDREDTIPTTTKIIGYSTSAAKDYASKYSRPFESIDTPITLHSIAITTPAAILVYAVGDTLDLTGLVVTGTYSDASTKVETLTNANVTGFDSSTAAIDQVLTITVGLKTTTYKVQIVASQQEGNYTFIVSNGKAQITKFIGYGGIGGVTIIPNTLGGAPVTSIADRAFYGCTYLTDISIPYGVTSIGNSAFTFCLDLTSISIPESVTSIGDLAFYGCKGLTSISIPHGVTSIGNNTFYDCTGLTSINIPQGVISIDDYAFYNCVGLTSIRFNSPSTTIFNSSSTIPAETKIIGYNPSTAKEYASNYGRIFEVIDTTITLRSIEISTPAKKLIYTVGNTLDLTDLVVTGRYSDASTKVETVTAANISGFDSATAVADQVLTITVGAQTTTYKVQIVANPNALTGAPVVRIGVNPKHSDSLGIFIGLKDIKDLAGNVIINPNVSGYQIEVDFDPNKVAILDVFDEANLGQFTKHVDMVAGKVSVSDAVNVGTANFNNLFFISFTLKGSALDSTSLSVKYLKVGDTDLHQISVENPINLEFHRGKIFNEGPGIQPSILDAVAGLQYLAGQRDAGTNLGLVNSINMASIDGLDTGTTILAPSVKDIIFLLQYLANMRDSYFAIVKN